MISTIYLIRHAQPDRTTSVRYDLEPGPPLTPTGVQEAHQAATWLAAHGLEYLFCSPFARTSQTGDMIADQLGLPISYVKALSEHAPGEAMQQIRERVAELLTQLDDSPLLVIGLVTHGACIKAILLNTTDDKIDLSKHTYDYGNHAPTAGIWRGVRGDQGWQWELAFRPQIEGAHATAGRADS